MILQALTEYYQTLSEKKKVAKWGWCDAKVSFALSLSKNGQLKKIVLLKREEPRGKKMVWCPQSLKVPAMAARSSGVLANFLCDNSKYLLGVDAEGANDRTLECFEAAKQRHLTLLENVHSEMAEAILAFFTQWDPKTARDQEVLQEFWEELTAGSNLIFDMDGCYAQEDSEIKTAWEQSLSSDEGEKQGICLVTGKMDEIARIHGTVKGVMGAQSSGAALVSFNAPAFESYGKEQSYNAPVGKYAAFAYTTALNYMLTQRNYVVQLGDNTVVFWAEDGKEVYQDVFCQSVIPTENNQGELRDIFQKLQRGERIELDGVELNPKQKFFILGLAPNAARLSVSFFYQNSFGNILRNIRNHYQRMAIVKPSWVKLDYLGIDRMLQETVNQNAKEKKPLPNMTALLFRAILSDGRYPESLYSNVLIRIRAEQGTITPGRAAIIKAYLIKNGSRKKGDESMGLDEERNDTPYILGRMFALLEAIQETANKGINSTIRDRYFNSASAAPASVFPILLKLKNSHIRKIERQNEGERSKVYYEKQLTELMGKMTGFPKRMTLEEQGDFAIGYYHQVQKRYEKKEEK